jgi:hypothetical protein
MFEIHWPIRVIGIDQFRSISSLAKNGGEPDRDLLRLTLPGGVVDQDVHHDSLTTAACSHLAAGAANGRRRAAQTSSTTDGPT